MSDIDGFITVAEAAKRLHRSEEQVRRNLRQGKLRGKRVGNQWFVPEEAVNAKPGSHKSPLVPRADDDDDSKWLIPRALLEEMNRSREATFKRNGIIFDIVADIRAERERGYTGN